MRLSAPVPKPASSAHASGPRNAVAPRLVQDVLRSSGQPLDRTTHDVMQTRFKHDFSGVRVYSDSLAAHSSEIESAAAYTVGSNVVFGRGRYAPATPAGRELLAHELTHVLEPPGTLRRFHLPHPGHTTNELPLVALTYAALLATMKKIITDSTKGDLVDMDLFLLKCGGQTAASRVNKKLGVKSTQTAAYELKPRYLFTCRCGLIDMRHFIQLMYISNFMGSAAPGMDANRFATEEGREHELLPRDPESRFGPEDTPTNALGAFTGTRLAMFPRPDALYETIKATLDRCDPIDFGTLSAASKNVVLHYYADLVTNPANPAEQVPKNQNRTAIPAILDLPECGGRERSFPFSLDTDDPDRKTISGTAFDKGSAGLTSDSGIRDFVSVQRPAIIAALPKTEKIRLMQRLLSGWVSDADIDAAGVIYKNAPAGEKSALKAAVNPDDLWSDAQKARLRAILAS